MKIINMTNVLYFLVFLSGYLSSCHAQNLQAAVTEPYFEQVYTLEQYHADLMELAVNLTEKHPKPYVFISKDSFWELVESKKEAITATTTYPEFIWMCSELVASIACGHTNLTFFNQESKVLPRKLMLPLEACLIEDRLYVVDPLINEGLIQTGDEIFAINGVNIETIKSGVFKHISSDGNNSSGKSRMFNGFLNFYVPYYLEFPASYEVLIKGNPRPIQLNQLSEWKFNPISLYPVNCEDAYCLDFSDQGKTAILTVNTFEFGGQSALFNDFLENGFSEIQKTEVENLIIDLRRNGGGRNSNAFQLLRFLARDTFTYFDEETEYEELLKNDVAPFETAFKGETYILTSKQNFSSVNNFLSMIKQHNWATLIGEETAGTYTCNADSEYYNLTYTGILVRNATRTFATTANDFPLGKGIFPDHNIRQTMEDYILNRDTVMNYIFRLLYP